MYTNVRVYVCLYNIKKNIKIPKIYFKKKKMILYCIGHLGESDLKVLFLYL